MSEGFNLLEQGSFSADEEVSVGLTNFQTYLKEIKVLPHNRWNLTFDSANAVERGNWFWEREAPSRECERRKGFQSHSDVVLDLAKFLRV